MDNSQIAKLENIDQAANIVLEKTLFAACQKTSSVAGAIINDDTGEVIHVELCFFKTSSSTQC